MGMIGEAATWQPVVTVNHVTGLLDCRHEHASARQ